MAQDLREMFREDNDLKSVKLNEGHQKRFAAKLDKALPKEKSGNTFLFLKIAAVLVVAFGIGFAFFAPGAVDQQLLQPGNEVVETPVSEEIEEREETPVPESDKDDTIENNATATEPGTSNSIQLSDVSPEFKKVETYYLASLNFELAKLEVTEENKLLLDSFMEQLAGLEKEYQRLNEEFMEVGANEQTVEAMIRNLQLRLELLYKVKNKIKEIKQSKNENYENYKA